MFNNVGVWNKDRCKTRKPVKKHGGHAKQWKTKTDEQQTDMEQVPSSSRNPSSSTFLSSLPPSPKSATPSGISSPGSATPSGISSPGSATPSGISSPGSATPTGSSSYSAVMHKEFMQNIYKTYQKSLEVTTTLHKVIMYICLLENKVKHVTRSSGMSHM